MDIQAPLNTNQDANITRMQKLVEQCPICLFATVLDKHPVVTRPMSVRKVCDEGNFWFLSSIDSNKNIEVGIDDRVQLFFVNLAESEFLSIYGKAEILTDKDKIRALWIQSEKGWFIEGTDDSTLSIIKVKPLHIDFWDSRRGKMAELMPREMATETKAVAEAELAL